MHWCKYLSHGAGCSTFLVTGDQELQLTISILGSWVEMLVNPWMQRASELQPMDRHQHTVFNQWRTANILPFQSALVTFHSFAHIYNFIHYMIYKKRAKRILQLLMAEALESQGPLCLLNHDEEHNKVSTGPQLFCLCHSISFANL